MRRIRRTWDPGMERAVAQTQCLALYVAPMSCAVPTGSRCSLPIARSTDPRTTRLPVLSASSCGSDAGAVASGTAGLAYHGPRLFAAFGISQGDEFFRAFTTEYGGQQILERAHDGSNGFSVWAAY
jgi:hypothetical protein